VKKVKKKKLGQKLLRFGQKTEKKKNTKKIAPFRTKEKKKKKKKKRKKVYCDHTREK
jgi:hypothetical protein